MYESEGPMNAATGMMYWPWKNIKKNHHKCYLQEAMLPYSISDECNMSKEIGKYEAKKSSTDKRERAQWDHSKIYDLDEEELPTKGKSAAIKRCYWISLESL